MACFTSFKDQHIFVIGGDTQNLKDTKRIPRKGEKYVYDYQQTKIYDIEKDGWRSSHRLQEGRLQASGCELGDYMYVFCGFDYENSPLGSIERLNAKNAIKEEEGD